MLAFVAFVVGVLVVGGLLFLGASLLLGRGETQPPAELDRSPVELPDDRPVTADDVRALRISPVLRGYRMTEVDWILDQFALVLEERDAEIAALTEQVAERTPATQDESADDDTDTTDAPPTTRSLRMPELVERIDVDAPPERVWAVLTDWEAQGEWMLATDVRTVGGPAQRLHGRLAARTGLPLPGGRHVGILDTMIITKWEPPRLVEVQHTGRLIRGPGIFEIEPRGEHSTFVWTERLYLPYGYLGELGWRLIRPFAVFGIRRSLRRFAAVAARAGIARADHGPASAKMTPVQNVGRRP